MVHSSLDTMGFTIFLVFVGRIGPVELAATSIAFSLNLLVFLPVMGFGQAVEVLVGQRLGENNPDLAASSTWRALFVALSVTLAFGLIYLFAPEVLANVFRSDSPTARWDEVGPLVVVLMRFVVVYCIFDTTNLIFSFALRGAGDTALRDVGRHRLCLAHHGHSDVGFLAIRLGALLALDVREPLYHGACSYVLSALLPGQMVLHASD